MARYKARLKKLILLFREDLKVIPENVKTPDPKKIIIATVSALVTATTITFAFILPAEL